jgi:hypothetical protein
VQGGVPAEASETGDRSLQGYREPAGPWEENLGQTQRFSRSIQKYAEPCRSLGSHRTLQNLQNLCRSLAEVLQDLAGNNLQDLTEPGRTLQEPYRECCRSLAETLQEGTCRTLQGGTCRREPYRALQNLAGSLA